mmetsp:Transcript_20682/g.42005  ORF Transcript_20682/g.42005 Transcript_20682/m.42005 type:complete len:220 (+) Transcript_20682:55-714(+)|eukprot:CAMPEP_0181312118 /NCGR_PEP_ID=MMETSP1101-20121128/13517_1 /TAXON_ID=46948 /ORGANISM="Rhodomonas abbreviata, Strain Caron Lab Isolate" /LENGTH=219 /DNA_ID=CAMNT_0023418929 /DNA_START=34 /DNA_END=693 /DNA_ORIENTATION=-
MVHVMGVLRRTRSMFTGSRQKEKCAFTDHQDQIKVDAEYKRELKVRGSFIVDAEVCLCADKNELHQFQDKSQKLKKTTSLRAPVREDASAKVALSRSSSMRTWHKKDFSRSLRDMPPPPTEGTYEAGDDVPLDVALDALELIKKEMQDLKTVLEDLENYSADESLQRSLLRIAGQKQKSLTQKLDSVYFGGADAALFDGLKENLQRTLHAMMADVPLAP